MSNIAPQVSVIAMLVCIIACQALLSYTMNYLKRVHNAAWQSLGRPSLVPADTSLLGSLDYAVAGARFYGFVVFSNQHKALGDARLATLAWSLRMLLALLFLLPFLIYRNFALISNIP